MGWFWGSSETPSDAIDKLDPGLREFLEDETPRESKLQPSRSTPTSLQILQERTKQAQEAQRPAAAQTQHRDGPAVPRESLFQDGRYAHLWKDYRPLTAVEEATKTDQE
ncbi:hypothetical protein LTS18_013514, partial [Coniosporium uncinatum]